MRVRICPLCDCEMTKRHYCDTCHSFIWRPEVLDIHYNAHARGKNETDCAYGTGHEAFDHYYQTDDTYSDGTKRSKNKKKPAAAGRAASAAGRSSYASNTTKSSSSYTSSSSYDDHRQVFGNQNTKPKKKKRGCLIAILIWVICTVVVPAVTSFAANGGGNYIEDIVEQIEDFFGGGSSSSSSNGRPTPAAPPSSGNNGSSGGSSSNSDIYAGRGSGSLRDNMNGNTDEAGKEDEASEIPDPEDYPEGCQHYAHMEMTSVEAAAALEAWLESMELSNACISTQVQAYDNSDGNNEVRLEYCSDYRIDGTSAYIQLNYDMVTDQVHYIWYDYFSRDMMTAYLNDLLPVLSESGDMADTSAEALIELYDQERGFDVTVGNMRARGGMNPDGSYWLDLEAAE